MRTLFGETGAALVGGAGLRVVYFSNATSTLVVRCRREAVRELWAALCFMRTMAVPEVVGGKVKDPGSSYGKGKFSRQVAADEAVEVVMRVVRVSGTIRKSEEELIRRARDLIGKVNGVEEVARVRGGDLAAEGWNESGEGKGKRQEIIDAHESNPDQLSEDDEQDEEMLVPIEGD